MEKKFSVKLASERTTDVLFASSLLEAYEYLSRNGNAFWVFDEKTVSLLPCVPQKSIVIKSGESNKTIESIMMIIEKALLHGSARDTLFIAFGGGVICDMTALASSLYMRGTRLALVPTTLLCMVDASLGGKTAIDYAGAKNLVGSFYPADEVIIAPDALRSLPDKEYMCGLGEVIKHAFLSRDENLYDFLLKNRERILKRDESVLEKLIEASLDVKKFFLELDPAETKGIRSYLNLAHTFAHALESISLFSLSHGEAVAWGLGRALEASNAEGYLDSSFYLDGINLLRSYGYDVDARISEEEWPSFLAFLKKDKKKTGGDVKFVLLHGFGRLAMKSLDDDFVKALVVKK